MLNVVQNLRATNAKQRALVDLLSLVDQFLDFTDNPPIAGADALHTSAPVISI